MKRVSWIRFGEEGLKILLKGVNSYRREAALKRRVFEWKENGRSYRLDCRENAAGGFIFCSVMDVDGKRHRLFFPEGKGLIRGWALLAEVFHGLDFKMNT